MTRRHYLVSQIRFKASTAATVIFTQTHAKASARVLQRCDVVARVQGRPRPSCKSKQPESDSPLLAETNTALMNTKTKENGPQKGLP